MGLFIKAKFYTALFAAKLSFLGLKLLKRPATSYPGYIALKICPDFLAFSKKYIKNNLINVTGTNGKTTTSGLIAHILGNTHQSVIHNLKGANMLTGIVNAFALSIRPFKRFDYAVVETDEAYLTRVYDFVKGDILVVTNLFRDQLDRYGELDYTAKIIKEAISKNPDLKLILNADDPIVASFAKPDKTTFYGFEDVEYHCRYKDESHAPSEIFNCICEEPLKYTKRFYAQQGHYFCDKCGYKRPECDYSAKVKIFDDYSLISVKYNGVTFDFKVNLTGLYNAYNALAAIAAVFENGLNQSEIQNALDTYHSIFGRTETRIINGHKTLIQLIKNPAGASEVLKTVDLNSNILIAINDDYADGRDISWLWDSDFEQLKNAQKLVVTSGKRAYDMAARLKYAGIPQEKITVVPDVKKAVKFVANSAQKDEKITILPSYTALLKISKY